MLRPPPRKSIPTETRNPVQGMQRYSQKCVLQSLARKVNLKEQKITQLNFMFHPLPRRPCWANLYNFWRVVLDRQSNFKSIDSGVWGLRVPKIWSFPLTWIVALTTFLRTNVLHCDTDTYCKLSLCMQWTDSVFVWTLSCLTRATTHPR